MFSEKKAGIVGKGEKKNETKQKQQGLNKHKTNPQATRPNSSLVDIHSSSSPAAPPGCISRCLHPVHTSSRSFLHPAIASIALPPSHPRITSLVFVLHPSCIPCLSRCLLSISISRCHGVHSRIYIVSTSTKHLSVLLLLRLYLANQRPGNVLATQ